MARTKQTARKCLVPAPRSGKGCVIGKAPKKMKKRNNRNAPDQSDSQSQLDHEVVNNQQFSVKFDDQAKCEEQAVQAKIIYCTNCQAIYTSHSKILFATQYKKLLQVPNLPDQKKQKFHNNVKNTQSVWICEFCLTHNLIPKSYSVALIQNPCFLIQKVNKKKNGKNKDQENDQSNKILIFCIDISGSMDFTVLGNKSRLDTVKQAIIDQINRMNFQKQVIKVGLVTFGSLVSIIGDAKTFKEKVLDAGLYSNFDKIVQQCAKITNFASTISKSANPLKKRIQNLGVYGSTALGPGLLASIQIASKGGIGSKVIICTDGQANVGIGGSFSPGSSDFYEKAANFAKTKRVSVSILSLKGDKCNLKELGKLSLASGGSILKIQPKALGTEFSKIAKQQILGTSSELVIKVNKIFELVSHVPNQLSADKTTLKQDFGNFSSQTQLTFQFKVLTKQEGAKKVGVDLDLFNQPQVPMQVQLTYIGRNGNKYMQVITDWRQLTENQKQIYEGANFGLFAASVLQRASTKIKAQQFTEAQKIIKGYWSIVQQKFSKTQSAQQIKKFGDRVKKIQSVLNSKMSKKGLIIRGRDRSHKLISKARKASKPKKAQKQPLNSKNKRTMKSESQSSQQDEGMSSDEQEQILYKEMRARSRSRSVSQDKSNKKRK